jgi:protein-glutamine gamma-glutamyltransferase
MVDRERIPIFTTIKMKYGMRPNPIMRTYKRRDSQSDDGLLSLQNTTRTEWEAVLESWVQECATNEKKIDVILSKLRSEFTLDPARTLDDGCSDAIDFFVEGKRGPAFLFATTAALMLAKVGFESRVANGFYIDSEDYDPNSSHYAATSKNLHWWTQIRLADGTWLSLEPSPGFDPPREHFRWWDRIAQVGHAIALGVTSHPFISCLVIATCGLVRLCRKSLADTAFTLAYRLASLVSDECRFRWAIWLIEKRASLAGVGRPSSQTPKRWFPKLVETSERERSSIEQLIEREYWNLYAPSQAMKKYVGDPNNNSSQVTKTVLERWTIRNMQRAKRCPIHSGI